MVKTSEDIRLLNEKIAYATGFVTRQGMSLWFAGDQFLQTLCWLMKSTGRLQKYKALCWKQCRNGRLPLEIQPLNSMNLSLCLQHKILLSRKALTRYRKHSPIV